MTTAWKELFAAALAETSLERLPLRIDDARKSIWERIDKLIDDPERQPEHYEIIDALNRLDRLEFDFRDHLSVGATRLKKNRGRTLCNRSNLPRMSGSQPCLLG